MAQLRTKAHQVRNGHIAKLEETRHVFARLPTSAKKKAAADLAARYNQIIGTDTRLERLDKAVAENEKRIRDLTRQAQTHAAKYNHQKLYETIKAAEKLQHHNSKLFKIIEQTEHKLSAIANKVANEVKQIEK
jgi:ABC-type transporter Mla subunit MlaD